MREHVEGNDVKKGNIPSQQEITGSVIIVSFLEVGEIGTQWRMRELLSEEVDFVQEQNLSWGLRTSIERGARR